MNRRLRRNGVVRGLNSFLSTCDDQYIRSCSYYKDEALKSPQKIREEISYLVLSGKGGSDVPQLTFELYMIVGADRASVNIDDYLFLGEFLDLQYGSDPAKPSILANKVFTLVYLAARGVPVSRILGQVDEKCVFHNMDDTEVMPFHDWLEQREGAVFCKQPDGMQGSTCFVLEKEGDHYLCSGKPTTWEELSALSPRLQVEEVIPQHEEMAAIYPQSVNTCRIVTGYKDGEAALFSCYALFGAGGARTSNGHSGGILVSIDENGCLGEKGFRDLAWGGGVFKQHPDTGVEFAGHRVPFFKEALAIALKAHRFMPIFRSVGWDVAITPAGPIIIEGNPHWATVEHQIFRGGLRKKAYELLS